MENKDGIWFFQQALIVIGVLAGIFFFAVLVLSLEHKHAPQAPAVTGNGSTSSPSQPAALPLSHPLPYVATVRDCLPSGRQCSDTRYYISKEQK